MSFNFGKENVNEGGNGNNIVIFNGGVAGRITNVSLAIEKKGVDYQDEGKNKPDYNIVYTDANGGFVREGFYYLNPTTHNSQYTSFDKAVEKQWNKLGSIVVAAGGDPAVEAASAVEMLDKMAVVVKYAIIGKTFNVLANYGTTSNPKKYITIRSWVPFIEASTVTEDITKLKPSNLDQIERLVQDNGTGQTGGAAPSTEGWV